MRRFCSRWSRVATFRCRVPVTGTSLTSSKAATTSIGPRRNRGRPKMREREQGALQRPDPLGEARGNDERLASLASKRRSIRSLKRRDYTGSARGPLDGIRVLDLSRLFAGNVLTQILGDFGAEVIKVEPPVGDTLRAWQTEGVATHWKVYARNKKSLCLDLHKPRSRELLLELASTSDMLIESFRPGVLEKMGLGPSVLLERNPRLIVVRISGWGQSGPYHQRPGFGTLIEGMSGFAAING